MGTVTFNIQADGRSTTAGIHTADTQLIYNDTTNEISGTKTGLWGTVATKSSQVKTPPGKGPVRITTYNGTTRVGPKTFQIVKNDNVVVCLILDPPDGSWWNGR